MNKKKSEQFMKIFTDVMETYLDDGETLLSYLATKLEEVEIDIVEYGNWLNENPDIKSVVMLNCKKYSTIQINNLFETNSLSIEELF